MTAGKFETKEYLRHTGFPGGQRSTLAKNVKPERLIEMAVKGMLPKNRLGRRLFTNLFVYVGTEVVKALKKTLREPFQPDEDDW